MDKNDLCIISFFHSFNNDTVVFLYQYDDADQFIKDKEHLIKTMNASGYSWKFAKTFSATIDQYELENRLLKFYQTCCIADIHYQIYDKYANYKTICFSDFGDFMEWEPTDLTHYESTQYGKRSKIFIGDSLTYDQIIKYGNNTRYLNMQKVNAIQLNNMPASWHATFFKMFITYDLEDVLVSNEIPQIGPALQVRNTLEEPIKVAQQPQKDKIIGDPLYNIVETCKVNNPVISNVYYLDIDGNNTYCKPYNKIIQCNTIKTSGILSANDLASIPMNMNIDITKHMVNSLTDEMNQIIKRNVVNQMFYIGWKHHRKIYNDTNMAINIISLDDYDDPSKVQNELTKTSVNTFLDEPDYSVNLPYICTNKSELLRAIESVIELANSYIRTDSKFGDATFLITNTIVASIISNSRKFMPSQLSASLDNQSLTFAGTYANGINVYIDPLMPMADTNILLGRRGPNEQGIRLFTYDLHNIQFINNEDGSRNIINSSRIAVTPIGPEPENHYISFKIDIRHKLF